MHGEVSISGFGVFYPINRKNFRLPSMRNKTKALKSDGSNLKAYGGHGVMKNVPFMQNFGVKRMFDD